MKSEASAALENVVDVAPATTTMNVVAAATKARRRNACHHYPSTLCLFRHCTSSSSPFVSRRVDDNATSDYRFSLSLFQICIWVEIIAEDGVIDDGVGRELAMGLGRRKKDREGVFVDCGIKGNEDEMNEGHKKK
ncbi:hypothetical protein DEO72_LG10g1779 [Vigna unguiculata]|uniref:Uncharacterized protein n=1 Tax=Vigna unguiculata TaxID=3917 RepID=A0A4D6NDD9_VIGUN|nr:hypothetical protein DEO72_LG10g1779 [Vigna unguiculata]